MFVLTPIGLWLNGRSPRWYMESSVSNLPLVLALRFLLLNVAMVPSSLKVTLELIKILYTSFIHHDPQLNATPGTVHCHSMALNEALGCVRFILTDKTGTLTQNRLLLKELSLADRTFLFFSFSLSAESPFSLTAKPTTLSLPPFDALQGSLLASWTSWRAAFCSATPARSPTADPTPAVPTSSRCSTDSPSSAACFAPRTTPAST